MRLNLPSSAQGTSPYPRDHHKGSSPLSLLSQSFDSLLQHAATLCEQLQQHPHLQKISAQQLHQCRLAALIVHYCANPPHSNPQPMQLESFAWEWAATSQSRIILLPETQTKRRAQDVWIDANLLMPLLDGFLDAGSARQANPLPLRVASSPNPSLTVGEAASNSPWIDAVSAAVTAASLATLHASDALLLAYSALIAPQQPVDVNLNADDSVAALRLTFTPL